MNSHITNATDTLDNLTENDMYQESMPALAYFHEALDRVQAIVRDELNARLAAQPPRDL